MSTNEENLRDLAYQLLNIGQVRERVRTTKHADFEFDMCTYNVTVNGECHACAVGTAWLTGIGVPTSPSKFFSYNAFAYQYLTPEDENEDNWYAWCFDADWDDIDGTSEGAAFRILYGLKHGVPEWFDSDFLTIDNEEEYNDLKDSCQHTITKEFLNDYESRMDRVSSNPIPS